MHAVLFSNPRALDLYSCIDSYESNGGVAATGWPQSFNELILKIHQTPPNSK